jgi:uncharacterized LabA/DUF88 family protein
LQTVALFIDNSNFYHSLKESRRLPFPYSDYDILFSKLEQQFGFKLKKIVLYDAMKDIGIEPGPYARQQKFHSEINTLKAKWPISIRTRKLRYRKLDKNSKRRIPEEKGVDILLVVDAFLTALDQNPGNAVDAIIILSGDADFVPMVEAIQTKFSKEAINLHLYTGSSTELRTCCKRHILISFENNDILLR